MKNETKPPINSRPRGKGKRMKANPSKAEVLEAVEAAFSPDVSIELGNLGCVKQIVVHNPNGAVWFNRCRQRFNHPLIGLSVDALTNDWPGITFETIMSE